MGDGKINLGGVYENFVAQELTAHSYITYFYNSHSVGELDFVIEHNCHALPIEVKSGKDYFIHSAISKTVANEEYQIDEAYVFANCNVKTEGRITYYPIYMCAFIKEDVKMPILSLE